VYGSNTRSASAPSPHSPKRYPRRHPTPRPPRQLLEFQAYHLTGAGLLRLTALPHLESLSVQGLDCLSGLDGACFRLCPSLKQLSLSGDYVPPPGAYNNRD
jgi:hypothetical protein